MRETSVGQFAQPKGRRTSRIIFWRDIIAALCLKLVGLGLLYFVFVKPAERPEVTDQLVARHLLTTTGSADDGVKDDR